MAIQKLSFTSIEDFFAWAEEALVPAYFAAITTANDKLTGYRDSGKTEPVFEYEYGWSGKFTAYKSASVSRYVTGGSGYSAQIPEVMTCKNGVIIGLGDPVYAYAIITKTNGGETATIIGANSSGVSYACGTFYCTAWGDDTTLTASTAFTPRDANQTCLVPFMTDAPYGRSNISFTPYAFYIPQGQYYNLGMGTFWTTDGSTFNKEYITNGYWAIQDE